MKKTAVDADMEKVDEIINEINPETAAKLEALAADFEYGKIAELIKETCKSNV